MKKKKTTTTTLSRNTIYVIIGLLIFIEVICFARMSDLIKLMVIPDAEGLLPSNEEFYAARTQRLGWIAALLIFSVPLFYLLVIKKNINNLVKNLLSSVYALLITFFVAEGAFMYYAKSDAVGLRLSHDLWTRANWISYVPAFDTRNPPMQLRGKEDYTWVKNGKKKIFIVGDSFCAGDGVAEDKMFSSILAAKLPDYKVVNICERGADSRREEDNLRVFGEGNGSVLPDVLIWQYYANDIEEYAKWHNILPPYRALSGFQNFASSAFKGKYYLLDFVYWEVISPDRGKEYMTFLAKAYHNDAVINDHMVPVNRVITFCTQYKIPMLIVIFPILADIPKSEELYTRQLTAKLQGRGARVLDMTPHLKEIPVRERIVHNSNPHPSEQVHALAAEKILEFLK